MKISKLSDKQLKCLCQICNHSYEDERCAFTTICNKPKIEAELYRRILKIIEREVALQMNKGKK